MNSGVYGSAASGTATIWVFRPEVPPELELPLLELVAELVAADEAPVEPELVSVAVAPVEPELDPELVAAAVVAPDEPALELPVPALVFVALAVALPVEDVPLPVEPDEPDEPVDAVPVLPAPVASLPPVDVPPVELEAEQPPKKETVHSASVARRIRGEVTMTTRNNNGTQITSSA
jgi:hypothetical protein